MAFDLDVIDGTQEVAEDLVGGVHYELAVRVEGAVSSLAAPLLGPAVNALYAQALATLAADPTLGGLATDVREGVVTADEGAAALGLEVVVARDAYSAPAATLALHLAIPYWQPTGVASRREPILAALKAALEGNIPGPGACVRERVLVAFAAHVAAALAPVELVRNGDRPARLEAGPVAVLYDGDQAVEAETLGETRYYAQVAVEVYVGGPSSAALEAQVAAVRQAIRSAGQLGGLVLDVEEADVDPEVLREAYTGPALGARLEARICYATVEGDPYQEVPP